MKRCSHCGKEVLSPTAERILQYCKRKPQVCVDDIMRELGIGITNANNYLRRLWEIGFLEREARNIPTGGLYFVYRIKETPTTQSSEE